MASVEVMTVSENVCQDLTIFLEILRNFASNPVWALILGGGISLWIWRRQTKLSFELELKREKRELYRRFISQIGKAAAVKHDIGSGAWELHPEVRRLWALQKEVELVGSASSCETSSGVLDAIEKLLSMKVNQIESSDGVMRSLDENVFFASDQMVVAMKRELGKNS
ncbi:hypothetical protein K3555_02690 [Leisingera sp. M527]|uniref:hypothetical protein n=1 Tax=Leisingera sp. M527 TaxID=2867014 RepID=UPI0021A78125|nr:hypothetical protein [Leisingera sp. M527]UWQ33445.1 hypothetical protein K3555_02690 [Leisingera sp. M527]